MRIGVTGGIGSGKSYVCRRIAALGYPIYDCDREAKRLMTSDSSLVDSLRKLMGEDVVADGRLDKQLIADFLFRSEENAEKVNALVHPVVREDFLDWANQQYAKLVFVESAILFQAQFDTVVDKVICVSAPLALRKQRVMSRDACSSLDFEKRICQQMDVNEVEQRADYVLRNDGIQSVDEQLTKIIQNILSC